MSSLAARREFLLAASTVGPRVAPFRFVAKRIVNYIRLSRALRQHRIRTRANLDTGQHRSARQVDGSVLNK